MNDHEGQFMDDADEYEKEIFIHARKRINAQLELKTRGQEARRKKARTLPMIETIKLVNDQFDLGVNHI